MLNLLNFAAVPFNSPIYERVVMGRQELREELVMELGRQLQDRDSQVSRLLLDTGHGGHQEDQGHDQTRKDQESSHVFRQSEDSAQTCLVIPAPFQMKACSKEAYEIQTLYQGQFFG